MNTLQPTDRQLNAAALFAGRAQLSPREQAILTTLIWGCPVWSKRRASHGQRTYTAFHPGALT